MTPKTIFLLRMSEPGSMLTISMKGCRIEREGRTIHSPCVRIVNDAYRDGLIVAHEGSFKITEEGRKQGLLGRRNKRVVN